MHLIGWIVAFLFVLVGIAGTVVPGLPGTILVFAGLWLAAWMDGFSRVGYPLLVVLGILSVLAYFLDVLTASFGVKRVRASRQAVIGAAAGTLAGMLMGFPVLICLSFLGAAAGEYLARNDLRQAGRADLAAWLGLVLGTLARLALVFVMLGIFFLAYFWPA